MSFDRLYQDTPAAFGSSPTRLLLDHVDRVDPSRPVVDVGAGQGRNALFLGRRGLSVDALEPSEVGASAIEAVVAVEGLPVRVHRVGFEGWLTDQPASAVLLLGLLPVLPPPAIDRLAAAVRSWSGAGTLALITGFGTDDPARDTCAADWSPIGPDSWRRDDGEVRTFLPPGRVTTVLGDGWQVLHHDEFMGEDHRHGDGPLHRHHLVRAVLRFG